MILYHFCPAHMVKGILREGLTKGAYPIWDGDELSLMKDTQWLTTESNPKKQSWATSNLIEYSRTDYRLTVDIPGNYRKKVVGAYEFIKDFSEENRDPVEKYEGSDDWYIYRGKIPPKWIVGCRKLNPR